MNVPFFCLRDSLGLFAYVFFDRDIGTRKLAAKWDLISVYYPLPEPASGEIIFEFDKEEHHLVGIQIIHWKSVLMEDTQMEQQDAPFNGGLSTFSAFYDGFLICLKLKHRRAGEKCYVWSDVYRLADPLNGDIVLDFDKTTNYLTGIELIVAPSLMPVSLTYNRDT